MKLTTAGVHVLVLATVGIVVGDFELRVKVHSYSNPGSRCAQCSVSIFSSEYSCCDSLTNSGMCAGEDLCDTFFQYCLRPVGSTGISCPNRASTATNYFSPNTDTLVDVGETVFGSENPFRISGPIWTGAQFFLESMDSNLYENRSAMLIDTFSADLDVSAGTSLGPTVYRGRFQLAQIELSFEVACIGNYTYSNCTTSEPPTNKPQTEPGQENTQSNLDLIGGVVGGILAMLLVLGIVTTLWVGVLMIFKHKSITNKKDNSLTSDPLGYNPTIPVNMSTDNPTYESVKDTATNGSLKAAPTFPPLSTFVIDMEVCNELDDEQERQFDNPLYGTPTNQVSHDLSHDLATNEGNRWEDTGSDEVYI